MVSILAKDLLLRSLRKRGWSISREKTDVWLNSGDYYVLVGRSDWKLFVQLEENLILVGKEPYGRRQSQQVKRLMENDKKERRRCSGI